MNEPLIQFKNVYKSFGENHVLNGTDLSIYKGEITTIIGKSGGGKSVLLKHIIGLLEQDSGTILFEGRPVSDMNKAERKALKRKCSYMFQGTALFDSLTIYENIALPLKETTSLSDSDINSRVKDKMEQLDLHEIDEKYPSQLSGGMKKRVALARALITDPEIVLFDEPTTGLDPIRKKAVHKMISDYQQKFGFTGVVISHDIPDIFNISQRVAMLNDGRVLFEGSKDELAMASDPAIKEFIQGMEIRHEKMDCIPSLAEKGKLAGARAYALPGQTGFSIILLHLDNLNEIALSQGPGASKAVLNRFVSKAHDCIRGTDSCFFYGQDGILILLPGLDRDKAEIMCDRLISMINISDILKKAPISNFYLFASVSFAEAGSGNRPEEIISGSKFKQSKKYKLSFLK
jgi:phospholipid/cholesterol/gamma-HCH transport system ATP-binding protein